MYTISFFSFLGMVSYVSTKTIGFSIQSVLITKLDSAVQKPNNLNGVNGDHGVNVQKLVVEVKSLPLFCCINIRLIL